MSYYKYADFGFFVLGNESFGFFINFLCSIANLIALFFALYFILWLYLHSLGFIVNKCGTYIDYRIGLFSALVLPLAMFIIIFLFNKKIAFDYDFHALPAFFKEAISYHLGFWSFVCGLFMLFFFAAQIIQIILLSIRLKNNPLYLALSICIHIGANIVIFYTLFSILLQSIAIIILLIGISILMSGARSSAIQDMESVHTHDIYRKDSAGNNIEKIGEGYTHKSKLSKGQIPYKPDKEYYT